MIGLVPARCGRRQDRHLHHPQLDERRRILRSRRGIDFRRQDGVRGPAVGGGRLFRDRPTGRRLRQAQGITGRGLAAAFSPESVPPALCRGATDGRGGAHARRVDVADGARHPGQEISAAESVVDVVLPADLAAFARALLSMVGQTLLIAVLLILVFGNVSEMADSVIRVNRTENLIFLLAVSAFWLGCNNSAKELVKERTIFQRERDYNLLVSSYVASKVFVLASMGVLQILLLFALVHHFCDPPGSFGQQARC